MKILVVGATGTNGREVVIRLAQAGQQVRALVRGAEKTNSLRLPNVEAVSGDLDDPASLDTALKGVDRAFIVTAVDQRAGKWFLNFLEAARRARTSRVVKFSGLGAGKGDGAILRQHGETDQALRNSDLEWTILQPNSFYQNMLWSARSIRERGEFYLPLGDAKQSLVDVRDIAAVAATVLTEEGHHGKTYEITGPEGLSYHDVAAKLAKVLGKPVRYVNVPQEAARQSMLQSGMPEWNATAVAELYGVFATGRYAQVTDTVQQITGRSPITFDQFARDHAGAFS